MKDPVVPKGESGESVQTDEKEPRARKRYHGMGAEKW